MTNKPSLQLVTAPTVEPLTILQVKNYLKVNTNQDDELITSLITTVRQTAEKFMRISCLNQTWKLTYNDYVPLRFSLPMGPVRSVETVKCTTRDGSVFTIKDSSYYLTAGNYKLAFNHNIMGLHIDIIYKTGYGPDPSYLPSPIKMGMLVHIAQIYDGRAGGNALPKQTLNLYGQYKLLSI